MNAIKESDWRLLRKLHPLALERFSQRTLVEAERVISDKTSLYHKRYVALYVHIQQSDEDMGFVFDDLRRSTAILSLIAMQTRNLITPEELAEFSEETRNLLNSFRK